MRMSVVVLLGIGAVVACSTPTSVCGCSPMPPARAFIVGMVRAGGDAPLGGALIGLRAKADACPGRGPTFNDVGFGAPSDSTGLYRAAVAPGPTAGDSICVQVVAFRSASMRTDSLVSAPVSMQVRIAAPFDSTRIDFRFP